MEILNQNELFKYIYIFMITPILIFAFEYIFEDYHYKPSVILKYIHTILVRFYTFIGECFARVSAFLAWFEFEKLKRTFNNLYYPIYDIIMSWIYVVKGYFNMAYQYKIPGLIYFGTFLIILILFVFVNPGFIFLILLYLLSVLYYNAEENSAFQEKYSKNIRNEK